MATISIFLGITITMFYNEHPPAHFHADYGEFNATYEVETLGVIRGGLPPRSHRYVAQWAHDHRDELLENWERMREGQPPLRITPLV
ncbi:MAG: DUF4160 domain-containing protein [Anaerolineae bacterium]|nr:DUF4160 domain-containing protein [Anaerolineae bacterium]